MPHGWRYYTLEANYSHFKIIYETDYIGEIVRHNEMIQALEIPLI